MASFVCVESIPVTFTVCSVRIKVVAGFSCQCNCPTAKLVCSDFKFGEFVQTCSDMSARLNCISAVLSRTVECTELFNLMSDSLYKFRVTAVHNIFKSWHITCLASTVGAPGGFVVRTAMLKATGPVPQSIKSSPQFSNDNWLGDFRH